MIPMPDVPVRPAHGRYAYFAGREGVGIVGYGGTLERAFEGAAEAAFALLTDPAHVRPQRTLPVSFIEFDNARALARWLGLLVAAARQHQLVFSEFHLQRESGRWWGCATGDRYHGSLALEVEKASTVHGESAVRRSAGGWEASCVIECARPVPSPRAAIA
jgi:SHS2 domain-containing protein